MPPHGKHSEGLPKRHKYRSGKPGSTKGEAVAPPVGWNLVEMLPQGTRLLHGHGPELLCNSTCRGPAACSLKSRTCWAIALHKASKTAGVSMLVTVMAQSSCATARTSRANSVRFEVLHLLGRRLAKSLEDLGRPVPVMAMAQSFVPRRARRRPAACGLKSCTCWAAASPKASRTGGGVSVLVMVTAQSAWATARTTKANSVRFEVLHLLGRRLAQSLEDGGRFRAGLGYGPGRLCNRAHVEGLQRAA